MLNCSELIGAYKEKNAGKNYLPEAPKRKYECDLITNAITRSEVKIVGEQFKTSSKHILKRQKL